MSSKGGEVDGSEGAVCKGGRSGEVSESCHYFYQDDVKVTWPLL